MSIAQQAAAWSESPHHAEVLVVLGGRLLIDWLLKTAARDESTPEQGQAEQALLRLLQSGELRPSIFCARSFIFSRISCCLQHLKRLWCAESRRVKAHFVDREFYPCVYGMHH